METFSALLAICAGNSPVTGEFPTQRPVTRSFDVYFDLRPNERLSKQSRGWWFETLSSPLWRHRNVACRNDEPMTRHWLWTHKCCITSELWGISCDNILDNENVIMERQCYVLCLCTGAARYTAAMAMAILYCDTELRAWRKWCKYP